MTSVKCQELTLFVPFVLFVHGRGGRAEPQYAAAAQVVRAGAKVSRMGR